MAVRIVQIVTKSGGLMQDVLRILIRLEPVHLVAPLRISTAIKVGGILRVDKALSLILPHGQKVSPLTLNKDVTAVQTCRQTSTKRGRMLVEILITSHPATN